MHPLIDDHSRLAYSEVLPDEKGTTCAGFFTRAAAYFAAHGITRIERVMTDNAWAYQHSIKAVCAQLGPRQKFIRPHCPWQNGKVERLNRNLVTEWAYRQAFTSNDQRAAALAPGSSPTTLSAATQPSADSHPPAAWHQPDGRVQLASRAPQGLPGESSMAEPGDHVVAKVIPAVYGQLLPTS